ncbi:putative transcriptional elongation regulator Elc1/Elongin C [Aspergillus uvarum CBS 121591]|uniref:E3 ubiquitin ligase complex SCF subunit sconC n=1 Tax=Aspergillus uvarum CBS 121591 TaxID=1448315 RepID=A0A319CXK7_9EURO|nr:putative transcriptional elongation regulator Elc1/Elongin C [Aspergillus uvarum CBS 121591]PYH83643.1 putative transcriptional elongation regulator Elc1/Elongin C [Aspergillus uvarum CBS 121591]
MTTPDQQAQDQDFVTLVSGDGFEFVLPRSTACISKTLSMMFDPLSKFSEALSGRCVLENISGEVLEKVCEYLCYNEKNKNQNNVPDMEIPPELCLELLMAADYLDV